MKYGLSKDDMYFNIDTLAACMKTLRDKNQMQDMNIFYQIYVYGKTFFTEKFGTLNFKSECFFIIIIMINKHKTFLTNDVILESFKLYYKKGFVNTLEGMVRNTNYKTEKTEKYKNEETQNEIQWSYSLINLHYH